MAVYRTHQITVYAIITFNHRSRYAMKIFGVRIFVHNNILIGARGGIVEIQRRWFVMIYLITYGHARVYGRINNLTDV